MELTKITGATMVSDYPTIQSTNMTKIENACNTLSGENVRQQSQINRNYRAITALKESGEGKTHRFETDDTVAYQKSVLTGAKCFDLQKIGGASRCFNQLFNCRQNGTGAIRGVTYTITDGKIAFSGTASSGGGGRLDLNFSQTTITVNNTHKYIFFRNFLDNASDRPMLCLNYTGNNKVAVNSYTVLTFPNNENITVGYNMTANVSYNCSEYLNIADLNIIYGDTYVNASTNEQLIARYSAEYPARYPYNAGEIISSSVENVIVKGRNLLDFDNWANNIEVSGGTKNVQGNSITLTSNSTDCYTNYDNRYAIAKIPCKPNTYYTISWEYSTNASSTNVFFFPNCSTDNMKYVSASAKKLTHITPSNCNVFSFRFGINDNGKYITYSNIQIEEGATATEYSQYEEPNTIALYSECADLKSANNAYDMVEFYSVKQDDGSYKYYKKKTQNIGSVDLGSLDWRQGDTNIAYSISISDVKRITDINIVFNALCASYIATSYRLVSARAKDKSIGIVYDNGNNYLRLYKNDMGSVAELKTSLSGVMLYYELETPIVTTTEIDNRLEAILCEAGGTITFEGSDSTYHIPVPNTEEYLVALSEVE